MKLDFWNNPLVVSSFRVRYRRGGIFNITTIYLMALVVGGIVLFHYRDRISWPWPRIYLLSLMGVQFFISAIVAASSTAASIRSEVANRTLDFQRICALSPQQILLGKLLGEPSLAYLLAIATVPLAAWCWILGVAGVSLLVLVLLYVNLATTTIFVGSLGLLHPLELATGKSGTASAANAGWGVLAVVFGIQLLASSRWLLGTPWSAAIVGLITPVAPLYGIFEGDPWHFGLSFFGYEIPFLLVTPLSQLVLAWLCFHVMVRRLINPLNPPFSKASAYFTLLVFDLLVGAVLFEPAGFGLTVGPRAAAFFLAHLFMSLAMVNNVTPWRESLHSWIWRLRGPSARLLDLWLGARSENWLALITFCLIGILGLIAFVLVPVGMQQGFATVQTFKPVLVRVTGASILLLLALGSLYQWCVAVGGRSGRGVFISLAMILMVPAHLVGYYWQIPLLEAVSPSAQFPRWLSGGAPLNLAPLLITYGAVLAITWTLLRRYISRADAVVKRKLQAMGVIKAVA